MLSKSSLTVDLAVPSNLDTNFSLPVEIVAYTSYVCDMPSHFNKILLLTSPKKLCILESFLLQLYICINHVKYLALSVIKVRKNLLL